VSEAEFVATLFGLMIFAGVAVLWMAMHNRRVLREFEHRERLAMIDRGLVPPPERDPAAFESRTGVGGPERAGSTRSRSAGIIMIGFGLALMMLITFAAREPEVGIGIGGAFALLGAAFIFNAAASNRRDSSPPLPPLPPLSRSTARPPESRSDSGPERPRDESSAGPLV
jgi:hypothetical protein